MRPSSDGFADMIDQAVAAAARVQEATSAAAEPVRAAAANGGVEIELAPNGRFTGLSLDPEMRRLPVERIAAAVLEAANAALDQQQAQQGAGVAVDLDGVMADLKRVQESAVPQMRSFLDAMTAAQDAAAGRAAR